MPSPVLTALPSASPPEARGADQWLSLAEVRRRLGAGESTIYRLMRRDPTFPRPAKLGTFNRWSAKELAAWMEARLEAAREAAR